MTIVFSRTTGAFYDLNSWPHELPDDTVDVSIDDHMAALDHLSQGGRITGDANGRPALTDPLPMSVVVMAAQARRRRDIEIGAVRWLIERHRDEQALQISTTLTTEDHRLVQDHIQALRDVPEQDGFPHAIDWPVLAPELLATGD